MTNNLIEVKNSKDRTLAIDWDPGNTCNYKCWYCFPGANTGDVPWPDADVVAKNLVHLTNYYLSSGKIDKVKIIILGGEPTLWPKLGELVTYLKQNTNIHITVLTNGSRTLRWWEKYAVYFDKVNISVHNESADIDHIINLTKLLDQKEVFYQTQVLMDRTNWNKCVDIVDKLSNSGNRFLVVTKTVTEGNETHYTPEQREYLKKGYARLPKLRSIWKHLKDYRNIPKITAVYENGKTEHTKNPDHFMIQGKNNFKDWECDLGINKLFIDRHGKVTGTCQEVLYGEDNYYNINDKDFTETFAPNLVPVICSSDRCLCAAETCIPKRRLKNA